MHLYLCSGRNQGFRALGAALLGSLVLISALPATVVGAESGAQWNLRDIYSTPEAWITSHDRSRVAIASLDRYKGTLGTSAETMLTALAAISDTRREVARLFTYAFLLSDEDVRNASNQERRQQAPQRMSLTLTKKTSVTGLT